MTFLDKDYNEKCYRFFTKYGVVSNNMHYSGKLTYSCEKKDSEYDVSFLTLEKITELMDQTLETGIDHLYEAVKDYPVPPFISAAYRKSKKLYCLKASVTKKKDN